jgi:hypothetical protein
VPADSGAVPEGGAAPDHGAATDGDEGAGAASASEGATGGSGADPDEASHAVGTPDELSSTEQGSLRSLLPANSLDRAGGISSARFEARIDIVGAAGSELPGPVSISMAGAFDQPNDASQLTMDFADIFAAAAAAEGDAAGGGLEGMEAFADAFAQPLEVITSGDRSWVKWGLLAMFGLGDDMGLVGRDLGGPELSSRWGLGGGGTPADLLELLADADADVEVVGSEDIRGVTTTHYRAALDIATLAEGLEAAERDALESELGAPAGAGYTVELWVDDQDQLHRLMLTIDDIPPGAEGGDLERLEITYDLWDHGLDLGITPPPADQIVTEDELGFAIDDLGEFSPAG